MTENSITKAEIFARMRTLGIDRIKIAFDYDDPEGDNWGAGCGVPDAYKGDKKVGLDHPADIACPKVGERIPHVRKYVKTPDDPGPYKLYGRYDYRPATTEEVEYHAFWNALDQPVTNDNSPVGSGDYGDLVWDAVHETITIYLNEKVVTWNKKVITLS